MNDRTLLELAVKAARIDAQWDCPERGMMMLTPDGIDTMAWNPLTDDGDALRLAAALHMTIENQSTKGRIVASWLRDGRRKDISVPVRVGEKSSEPIRRAIVLAAAQIGMEMSA